MKRLAFLALPVVALALTACGSSSSSSPASPPASSSPASAPSSGGGSAVTMQNIAFSPTSIHAKVGETVRWTNQDQVAHNVTYVSGPKFTSSATFGTGGKYSVKLTAAGTIHYRCTIHPGMNGTIVVAP